MEHEKVQKVGIYSEMLVGNDKIILFHKTLAYIKKIL